VASRASSSFIFAGVRYVVIVSSLVLPPSPRMPFWFEKTCLCRSLPTSVDVCVSTPIRPLGLPLSNFHSVLTFPATAQRSGSSPGHSTKTSLSSRLSLLRCFGLNDKPSLFRASSEDWGITMESTEFGHLIVGIDIGMTCIGMLKLNPNVHPRAHEDHCLS
jgi:hypothetical protein